jgi:nucleoside-diphosphate-sugar epimerase
MSFTLTSGDAAWDPASVEPAAASQEGSTAVPPPLQKAPLTDLDVSQRSPCLIGASAYDVETTVLRSARKGRLATHVVCPGLLYGRGECEAMFLHLFKQCWEATAAAPAPSVYGSGSNRLPLLHISDLAQYVAEVAEAAASAFIAAAVAKQDDSVEVVPVPQYLLVADESRSTQGAVVQAVSSALGTGRIRCN